MLRPNVLVQGRPFAEGVYPVNLSRIDFECQPASIELVGMDWSDTWQLIC
jgi:hypothetical protein